MHGPLHWLPNSPRQEPCGGRYRNSVAILRTNIRPWVLAVNTSQKTIVLKCKANDGNYFRATTKTLTHFKVVLFLLGEIDISKLLLPDLVKCHIFPWHLVVLRSTFLRLPVWRILLCTGSQALHMTSVKLFLLRLQSSNNSCYLLILYPLLNQLFIYTPVLQSPDYDCKWPKISRTTLLRPFFSMMAPRPCLFEHFQRFLKVNQKAHAARTLEQGNAVSRPFLSILFSGVNDNADVNDICVLLLTTGNRTLFPVRSRQIQYNHLSNNIRSSHQNTNCSKLRVQR